MLLYYCITTVLYPNYYICRLIQGSCSNIEGIVPRLWITDRGISNVKRRLAELKQGAQGLYDALHTEALSTEDLVDIHVGMDRSVSLSSHYCYYCYLYLNLLIIFVIILLLVLLFLVYMKCILLFDAECIILSTNNAN